MLKLGDKTINKLYLGDKAISKAYLGDKLVFQTDNPIFIEYLESTGTQWIDTGIATTGDTLGFTLEAMPFELTDTYPMGSRDSSGSRRFFGVSVRGTFFAYGWSAWYSFPSYNVVGQDYINTKVTMSLNWLNNRKVTLNQHNADLVAPHNVANGRNITLFGVNGQLLWKGRIYNAQISDGDKIIADLRPCIDPKGVVCMYDTVSHKYFYNEGTGELIPAPKFVEYLESTGEQYINTDYIMTSDVQEVECEFQYTDKTNTQQVFGMNNGANGGIYTSTNSGNIFIRGGSNSYTVNFSIDYTKKHTLYAKAEVGQCFIATFDGETKQSTNAINIINKSNPWYLFGLNKNDSDAINKYKGRIYLFKMYDNGVLVRDLRPCIDANGVACMYDMVTGNSFYNQGTGEFIAGGIL